MKKQGAGEKKDKNNIRGGSITQVRYTDKKTTTENNNNTNNDNTNNNNNNESSVELDFDTIMVEMQDEVLSKHTQGRLGKEQQQQRPPLLPKSAIDKQQTILEKHNNRSSSNNNFNNASSASIEVQILNRQARKELDDSNDRSTNSMMSLSDEIKPKAKATGNDNFNTSSTSIEIQLLNRQARKELENNDRSTNSMISIRDEILLDKQNEKLEKYCNNEKPPKPPANNNFNASTSSIDVQLLNRLARKKEFDNNNNDFSTTSMLSVRDEVLLDKQKEKLEKFNEKPPKPPTSSNNFNASTSSIEIQLLNRQARKKEFDNDFSTTSMLSSVRDEILLDKQKEKLEKFNEKPPKAPISSNFNASTSSIEIQLLNRQARKKEFDNSSDFSSTTSILSQRDEILLDKQNGKLEKYYNNGKLTKVQSVDDVASIAKQDKILEKCRKYNNSNQKPGAVSVERQIVDIHTIEKQIEKNRADEVSISKQDKILEKCKKYNNNSNQKPGAVSVEKQIVDIHAEKQIEKDRTLDQVSISKQDKILEKCRQYNNNNNQKPGAVSVEKQIVNIHAEKQLEKDRNSATARTDEASISKQDRILEKCKKYNNSKQKPGAVSVEKQIINIHSEKQIEKDRVCCDEVSISKQDKILEKGRQYSNNNNNNNNQKPGAVSVEKQIVDIHTEKQLENDRNRNTDEESISKQDKIGAVFVEKQIVDIQTEKQVGNDRNRNTDEASISKQDKILEKCRKYNNSNQKPGAVSVENKIVNIHTENLLEYICADEASISKQNRILEKCIQYSNNNQRPGVISVEKQTGKGRADNENPIDRQDKILEKCRQYKNPMPDVTTSVEKQIVDIHTTEKQNMEIDHADEDSIIAKQDQSLEKCRQYDNNQKPGITSVEKQIVNMHAEKQSEKDRISARMNDEDSIAKQDKILEKCRQFNNSSSTSTSMERQIIDMHATEKQLEKERKNSQQYDVVLIDKQDKILEKCRQFNNSSTTSTSVDRQILDIHAEKQVEKERMNSQNDVVLIDKQDAILQKCRQNQPNASVETQVLNIHTEKQIEKDRADRARDNMPNLINKQDAIMEKCRQNQSASTTTTSLERQIIDIHSEKKQVADSSCGGERLFSNDVLMDVQRNILQKYDQNNISNHNNDDNDDDNNKHDEEISMKQQIISTQTTVRKKPDGDLLRTLSEISNKDYLLFGIISDDTHVRADEDGNIQCTTTLTEAVAVIDEEDIGNDVFLPCAVEYDPDCKQPIKTKNHRIRLYAILAAVAIITGVIGVAIGVTSNTNQTDSNVIPYRETIGIRENLQILLGNNSYTLDDRASPYRKAMEWLMYDDPLQTTPDDEQFSQRFYGAYFYFATSKKQPWDGGCNQPIDNNETDNCMYQFIAQMDESEHRLIPSKRWLSEAHICLWAGIHCSEMEQVNQIVLSGNNFTGSFPEGIIDGFPFLQTIYLRFGQLTGTIPERLGNMKYLKRIMLSEQLLTGTIPSTIYSSRSLNDFDVIDNRLQGTISTQIEQLKDLKFFSISWNFFTGTIPSEIGTLLSVEALMFDGNSLNGTIPTLIGKLSVLDRFDVSRNRLSGQIPSEIGVIPTLILFAAHTNRLSGPIPEEVYNCTSLMHCILYDNGITNSLSPSIGKLTDLNLLDIRDNNMSGMLPTELGQITKLENLLVSGNNFYGPFPTGVCTNKMNAAKSSRLFKGILQADCKAQLDGNDDPEIICPIDCCTVCCNNNGDDCVTV